MNEPDGPEQRQADHDEYYNDRADEREAEVDYYDFLRDQRRDDEAGLG